jgi:sulfate permease, SulP family
MVEKAKPEVVLLDFRAVTDLEYTALKMLCEAEAKVRGQGRELWLAGLNPSVYEMVRASKLGATLGRERMYLDMQTAVDSFENRRAR